MVRNGKRIARTAGCALLSVYNKEGIVEFASALSALGYEIISTGGTAKALSDHGISVTPISQITGNPEIFDGRMKSISFQIEAGILFDRDNPIHSKQAEDLGIKPIDIVVCNLYPFEKVTSAKNVDTETAVEYIDVGGPTMVRAGAKNFRHVLTVVDPGDYGRVAHALQKKTATLDFKKRLAAKAFFHLSFYDSVVARYLNQELFPDLITLAGRKISLLRYGENPQQQATSYHFPNTSAPLSSLHHLAGRLPSLTNLTDINAGIECVRLFREPTAVIIKHNTPCGLALGTSTGLALKRAIEADPESAFGGVVVLNRNLDMHCARVLTSYRQKKGTIDIVVCTAVVSDTLRCLTKLRQSMGVYTIGKLFVHRQKDINIKWVDGGFIIQTGDDSKEQGFSDWKVVTTRKPTRQQIKQMEIAWKFMLRIRSNAVIVLDGSIPMTRGIGTGQTSRVRAAEIALVQAGKYAAGGILASDSFFPFDDAVKLAAKYRVGAILQQGGSINDHCTIAAANVARIPMVFSRRRAFWH